MAKAEEKKQNLESSPSLFAKPRDKENRKDIKTNKRKQRIGHKVNAGQRLGKDSYYARGRC